MHVSHLLFIHSFVPWILFINKFALRLTHYLSLASVRLGGSNIESADGR